MTPKYRPRVTRTLSFRLMFTFVLLMIIVVVAVSSITLTIYQRNLLNNLDETLSSSGTSVAEQMVGKLGSMNESGGGDINLSDYYLNAVLLDDENVTITSVQVNPEVAKKYGVPADPDQLLSTLDKTPQTVEGTKPGEQWRAIVVPITFKNLLMQPRTIGAVIIARPLTPVLASAQLVTRLLSASAKLE